MLLVTAALSVVDSRGDKPPVLVRNLPIRRLGMISLSVFMSETVLSQILVKLADALFAGWSFAHQPVPGL